MDYEYHQYQGQPSDQFHPKNKGKQVAVSLDIITEPDCEQNNTNGNNHTTDINDTTIMTEILNVNDTFKDWDAVETAVNMFAKYNSFVTIKFCKDLDIIDKTITRRHVHDESNAATIFLYLLKQHEEDPNYIVIPRLEGPSNKLTGLFWITSKQRNELWPKFHDVVIHNNTVKMNRYEMALSLFVGINNNFKTRVFAQALTKYETQADYIWILQCTLKVKNNLSPHVLYTDSDPAMLAAVQIVYPQTQFY
ncbi:hypothetical protein RhiirA4_463007 [Rhizophagus irregularis]|uniref:MULE transposase domain-containing protein n=1 Tax=Rhizophagus irregularis TaxID=588596 RepID=A0A2I1GM10_9GLOM|nr:hypothetical protein RhiirA4_463007 [Rhizophagus irregularis]